MTEGRPLGLLVRFALPLMAGDLIQQVYTIADSMVVGRLIGVRAFAAVSAGGVFYWLVLVIIFMLSIVSLLASVLIDILTALLDPRVHIGAKQTGEAR
jgi:Na+-driven multidrug efflux pump